MVIEVLKFTWYGTNSFKLYDENNSILIDPFIRYDKRKDIKYYQIFTKEKNILITHGHIDHILDIPSLYKDRKCNIYCLKTIYKRLSKRGISKDNLNEIHYNDYFNIKDFNITVYKSKHIKFDLKLIIDTTFNKRTIKYFKNLLYLGYNHIKNPLKKSIVSYYVKYKNKTIFIMGSMNLDENIEYPKYMDYLIIAYQGRSDLDKKINTILQKLEPKKVILTHFDDSFPPISSRVNIDLIKSRKNVIIPEYEKSIDL